MAAYVRTALDYSTRRSRLHVCHSHIAAKVGVGTGCHDQGIQPAGPGVRSTLNNLQAIAEHYATHVRVCGLA
eukprot:1157790-Pelagomonas_calceolata.AAC.8